MKRLMEFIFDDSSYEEKEKYDDAFETTMTVISLRLHGPHL
jgi:hypothetical protein